MTLTIKNKTSDYIIQNLFPYYIYLKENINFNINKKMYLKKVLPQSNKIFNLTNKKFNILDSITRNTINYRMNKYDPTKEIEVNFIF